ncbi:MAG: 4Fe-4S dicluster domain-containing protein [bacterium]|nr:4Fe-4S dicluster domain-containing protein [bacterium]
MSKILRKIIEIDESLCDGCEACIPACPEQAIQMVDTPEGKKAGLVRELYCDGLGACLGNCPTGALTISEREVEPYDDAATLERIRQVAPEMLDAHQKHMQEHGLNTESVVKTTPPKFAGCPSAQMKSWAPEEGTTPTESVQSAIPSELRQWPIQLRLVPPFAPYFRNSDIAIVADCVPFSYANFHQDFLKGKSLAIACPKLDDVEPYVEKLSQIMTLASPRSIEVVIMEVPCCAGLTHTVKKAMEKSGKIIPIKETIIGIKGGILKQVNL